MYVFLDTETTGGQEIKNKETFITIEGMSVENGVEHRICQLAFITDDGKTMEAYDEMCQPPVKMSVSAAAVTGITPEALYGKPTFDKTQAAQKLMEINKSENFLVIHNAAFDLEMLRREGFTSEMKLIDTLRVARHVLQDDERHSLQWQRYAKKLYLHEPALVEKVGKEVKAHDALSDVIVLKLFYDYLKSFLSDDKMVELTAAPIIYKRLTFGKYAGEDLVDVVKKDSGYLMYMLGNELAKDDKRDVDMVLTMRHHLLNEEGSVTVNFGKYKDRPLGDLLEDTGYIDWMKTMENKSPNILAILNLAEE